MVDNILNINDIRCIEWKKRTLNWNMTYEDEDEDNFDLEFDNETKAVLSFHGTFRLLLFFLIFYLNE